VDLDALIHHVDEPALGDSSTGVEAELVLAVGAIRGLRDLDNQHRMGRVCVTVGMPIVGHHTDIGLRFGSIVEGERQL